LRGGTHGAEAGEAAALVVPDTAAGEGDELPETAGDALLPPPLRQLRESWS